jgi:hypothetical protein
VLDLLIAVHPIGSRRRTIVVSDEHDGFAVREPQPQLIPRYCTLSCSFAVTYHEGDTFDIDGIRKLWRFFYPLDYAIPATGPRYSFSMSLHGDLPDAPPIMNGFS